jgi:hypothetical protein
MMDTMVEFQGQAENIQLPESSTQNDTAQENSGNTGMEQSRSQGDAGAIKPPPPPRIQKLFRLTPAENDHLEKLIQYAHLIHVIPEPTFQSYINYVLNLADTTLHIYSKTQNANVTVRIK